MAPEELKNIFLSASVPFKDRDAKYIDTCDVIAIRDAVIALTSVVIPKHRLIWGGHPSITPVIYHVMQRLGLNIQKHVILYQSKYFENSFPEDNNQFENVILTTSKEQRDSSLLHMRQQMFSENKFAAGVFIGGMEGVEDEYSLFRKLHPEALILPIASTGAAAQIVYHELPEQLKNTRLEDDYAYMSLFQELLIEKI